MALVLLVVSLVGIPIVGLFIAIFLYQTAKREIHASFTPTGTVQIVVAGNSFCRLLANVSGHHSDGRRLVKNDGDYKDPRTLGRFLQVHFGFYWVSILFPVRRLLEFDLPSSDRLVDRPEGGGDATLRDRVVFVPERRTNSLLVEMPHPVFVPAVLLKDGVEVDMIIMLRLRVTDPVQAAMVIQGKFFVVINQVVGGVITDYGRTITYNDLMGRADKELDDTAVKELLETGPGSDNELQKRILAANTVVTEATEGVSLGAYSGVTIETAFLVAHDILPQYKRARDAALAKDIEENLAAAAAAKAKGEAARVKQLLDAFKDTEVQVETVVRYLERIGVATSISAEGSGITTFVEGGVVPGSVSVAVPAAKPPQS